MVSYQRACYQSCLLMIIWTYETKDNRLHGKMISLGKLGMHLHLHIFRMTVSENDPKVSKCSKTQIRHDFILIPTQIK